MCIPSKLKNSFYILLFFSTISGCQKIPSSRQLLPPLPQDPLIQVYFNHAQSSEYQESYRLQTRLGDDLEKQIIHSILQAKSTIDVAVQELRLPKIAQALIEKQRAGVEIRLILENQYSLPWQDLNSRMVQNLPWREKNKQQTLRSLIDINKDGKITSEEIKQRDAIAMIQNSQIPWIDDTADGSKGSGLMHHKFMVIDSKLVIISSANFTPSDTFGDVNNLQSLGNANNLVKIDSPELANLFTQEFNIMWDDGPGGKLDSKFGLQKPQRPWQKITAGNSQITVKFSPLSRTQIWSKSTNGLIGKTLNMAVENIDMALFVFSDQKIANILENRHNQNVKIRALIDAQFAHRYYSEALDMMGISISDNCKYEKDNRPWQNPITTVGVPSLLPGDVLHHKFAVIDHQIVITGSHNWSEAANHNNDESLIIVENPTVAAHFQREFHRLYQTIKLELPSTIKAKIDQEIQECLPVETQGKNL
ncbi:phospholipase D-like domain-containing protein [Cylindrospermopsis raciborskii]|jgi:phosphatidylserine/phosphatidylglycerophosphate/cardiolipin synthase-like enzyme|uniref:phospholipase D-like domain-containing protein n=1 Tax=Cylindrospermopsis raciborskii TaxID=77022 RepID=UPI000E1EF643|nr:phospholipase D-like domain-containing protein [Cylindrospermopsis raciborskii]UJL32595.1 DUF1669 domain-containing protein [Cylindrospermopsis raciborskii Cr2010]UJS05051.1 phospholipase D-like domain-containing protein [Cylindrospermopsis raciborskii KLL07]